jgi:NitT/TauT family transport system permease protein
MVAYFISLFIAFLLATLVTSSQSVENILLPIFDVIESVPILAFFPIIITFFIDLGYVEGASLFILIMTMMWSILFTVVSGIKLIPEDIQDAAKVFGIKKWEYYRHVLFPGVFPEMVTGSILAFASAWDVTVVAEVLHIYMRNGSMSDDLLGLGSLLVNSNASGNTQVFTISLIILILLIALVNILVWQRLLRYSEKYKFE